MSIGTIYKDGGDWDIDVDMGEKLAATGEFGPPPAVLTGGIGKLVAAFGATAEIGQLTGVLVQRTAAPTRYSATLQGEQLATGLDTFVGQVVWRYVAFGTDYQRWVPFRVLAGRR